MKKFALTTHSSRSFFSQHWSHAVKPGCLAMALLVASALPAMAQTPAGGGKQQTTESQTPEKKVIYRGVVIDDTDAPLPGVSVTLPHSKGTGVTTDVNGRFEISVPESVHNLVFSYIGMKTQTVRVKGITKDITVRLESDAVNLKEAVVTGIYTRNAESFTGSMATYTNKELKQVGNLNVLQSLQALDPAFVITDNNLRGADPNATLDISIRGTTNLTDLESDYEYDPNQPLFILDGFESDLTTITNLNIDRVASITILKDAASTAIYGSKAANGVVVVETVKPEPGKLRFSYSGNYQVAWADLTDYNMMNAREKLAYEKLAGRYASGDYNLDANGEIIDEDQRQIYYNRLKLVEQGLDSYWLNEPLRTAFTQTHNIYVDGGDSAFLYGVGVNYSNTQGVMKGSGKDALNGNIRLTYRVDRLSFSNNTNLNYNTSDTEPVAFRNFVNANPYYSKYNENGEITKYFERTATLSGYEYAYNPLWDFNQKSYNRTNTFSLNNNFQVEWRILEELRLRGRFGVTIAQNESTVFHSPEETMFAETDRLERGTYAKNSSRDTSYDGTLDLTYGRTFGNHMLNLIGGMQFTESNSDAEAFSALGYMSDQYSNPNFSMGYPDGGKPSSTVVKSRTASYYFNLNYGYDMRYLVDLNLRTDGASVFGINNPFSTTWSFGLGWNVHNEKFLADSDVISYMKLRYSLGNPGNSNLDAKRANTVYNYYTAFQNPFGLAALVSQWGNKDLEWQRTLDQNIGIDLAFMDDRLRFTFDYFTKTTDPLLLSISLPPSTGTTTSPMNIGTMHNEGFTWQATYFVLRGNDYNWSLTANMNHVKTSYDDMGNYLEYLNEQGRDEEAYTLRRYYDGASPTALWAVRSAGIDPMTGNEVFIKKDGSYTFEWDTADEVVCGDTTPDVEGTFGTSAYWKGFSMNLIFSYRYGGQAFRQTLFDKVENISESDLMYNQDKRAYYDRWQKPGDHAKFKRIDDLSESHMTSRFIEDENTLKLTTLSFGYENQTAPWLKTIGASSFNVRLSMNDLFYLSTIKEERGLDYPFQRSVMMSLGLSF
ncbi:MULTISPECIES: SusC/RagA family TonB-linked outer membrane protein [Mediterranea]|uniref:SusC/RagA family TonB-linked outer membrane protein n=1 Tax=Mediterranea TaxID=1926659 RepID=UPI002012BB06|nr:MULTISPECIES: SusC/RagA family TonB-linked outer membrane protein [Mediterranea]MCL1607562.1 SusC/RagA family TonB-linked outer membrane protein [Mediterranea sp. ET5]MDM8122643.1 SusC/RagA family TonB-linked outer membrane protein [Mediterranea massiliensis]MDM8197385.1 SusC/RagA family TonB-linked outer membrane protein [Mediterranea massiliensis]